MQPPTHQEAQAAAAAKPPERDAPWLHQFVIFALLAAGVMYIAYVLGQCDYVLFQALVDLIGVLVALAIFIVTWHTRRFASDDAGAALGTAYLWVGILRGFYMMSAGWPPEPGGRTGTADLQTWVAARLLEAGALAAFPFLGGKRISRWLMHGLAGGFGLAALAWIYRGDFGPRAGASSGSNHDLLFSVSALCACALFAAATAGVLRRRSRYDSEVLLLLLCSLALNLLAESMFAFAPLHRISSWGIVPALCRLVALALLYKALVGTCLSRPYALLFRDLQQRDRRLSESRQRYASVVEDVPVMICSMRPDGIITFANSLFCSTFGLAREEISGPSFLQWLPEEVRPEVEAAIAGLSPAEPVTSCEHEVRLPNGTTRRHCWTHRGLFDGNGVLTGLQSCGEDITERVRQRQHVNRLAAAVEQAPTAIIIMDGEGRILYANSAFEALSGYPVAEAVGETINGFVHCPDREELLDEIFTVVRRGGTWRGHVQNRTKEGVPYEEELIVTGYLEPDGTLRDIVAVVRDVTREMEVIRQLHQMQKMDALGRLAGGVAHDFNNMLQIVATNAEFGLEESAPGTAVRDRLRDILAAARKAEAVVKQLLTFSRRREGPREVVRVDELVRQFASLGERVLGERIRVRPEIAPETKPVLADPNEIEQALLNLALNARDAMPDGGRLVIRTRTVRFTAGDCAERAWAREGEFTLLEVEDDGAGMPPEVVERVFEPFFTTKPAGVGTGLGLALVYGTVERHGGFIHLVSEPGRGTTFSLYFPVTGRSPSEPAADSSPVPPASSSPLPEPTGPRRILLVEDNPMVRRVALRVLERAGFEVLEAAGGHEALRLFAEHGDDLSALVLDVIMPDCTGREVWLRIREERSDLPVLFCTGYNEYDLGETVFGDPRAAIIQKPYRREELLAALEELLSRAARR